MGPIVKLQKDDSIAAYIWNVC